MTKLNKNNKWKMSEWIETKKGEAITLFRDLPLLQFLITYSKSGAARVRVFNSRSLVKITELY